MTMKLKELLCDYSYTILSGDIDQEVTSLTMDSREAVPRSLFICIKGYTVDGHHFVEEAIKKGTRFFLVQHPIETPEGCTVVLVDDTVHALSFVSSRFYNEPTKAFHLTGVTGTNGKTTVTNMLKRVYASIGQRTALIGTIQSEIMHEIFPTKNTTPDSLSLQKLFTTMRDKRVQHCVMEVSSHGLSLNRVAHCSFDRAIFTNLSQDHLDFHETMDAYKKAKGILFEKLPENGVAILNGDDEASEYFSSVSPASVLLYGIQNPLAVIRATDVSLNVKGISFSLNTPQGSIGVQTQFVGEFNLYNLLAVATSLYVDNVPLQTISEELEKLEGVSGRMEVIPCKKDVTVIVDFAHTPDALENVLSSIDSFTTGRVLTLFGCGGQRDKTKRPLMTKIAGEYSDIVVMTSDNPRMEAIEDIMGDMQEGVTKSANYLTITDRKEAIHEIIRLAKPQDTVVIAGKGHETYQIIGDETFPFDDREIVRQMAE